MSTTGDLERQAEQTRADLSVTLDEVRGTVTRTAITSGATAIAREGSSALARAAVRRATDNPMAALLIGAGLYLLFAGGNGNTPTGTVGTWTRRANDAVKGAAAKVGDAVSRTRSTVSDSAAGAQAAGEGIVSRAGDAVTDATLTTLAAGAAVADKATGSIERAREGVSRIQEQAVRRVHEAQDGAARVTNRLTQLAEEQPILVAALAVAVGAAAGAALPVTEAERRHLGPSGARVAEKGRDVAGHVTEAVVPKVAEAAEIAGDTVASDVLGERGGARG